MSSKMLKTGLKTAFYSDVGSANRLKVSVGCTAFEGQMKQSKNRCEERF